MFDKILENLLFLNEDSAGIKSLYKIYSGFEKGIDPDPTDLFTALDMMKDYYEDWIDFMEKLNIFPKKLVVGYHKRFSEIETALKSRAINQQIIALDNAINQWHIDFPVIHHLWMEIKGPRQLKFKNIVINIEDILTRLGKLPKKNSSAKELG